MLTQDACTVLSRIHASSVKSYAFVGTPQYQTFLDLKALNHIRVDHNDYCSLTPSGLSYLLSLQQQLEHQEQEQAAQREQYQTQRADADQDRKKQFRHDWRIALAEIFVSFALGAVADHFFDIVGKCTELWSAFMALFH